MQENTKKIYLLRRPHAVQRSLIAYPPRGYIFVEDPLKIKERVYHKIKERIKNRLSYNKLIKWSWENAKRFHNPILKAFYKSKGIESNPLTAKSDLIYTDRLLATKKKYWIDLEHVIQLMGWDIKLFSENLDFISRELSKEECGLITAYSKAGIKSVLDNIPNSHLFKHKCYFVHNAVPSINYERDFDKKGLTFIFIGSNSLPYDFYMKGGHVAIAAFKILSKKYEDIKLIVKPWAPLSIKIQCIGIKNIEFQGFSSNKEMDLFLRNSDILLSPNYNSPAKVFLDCMNYSIPVITTNLWANSEIIIHNYNGLLIPKSTNINYPSGKNMPNSRTLEFNSAVKKIDEGMVKNLVVQAEKLINNRKLIKKMGLNGKKEIDSGEFSIGKRNRKYKVILDRHFK